MADGGGGGGGGGGHWGGIGGATYGGDDGAYSGAFGGSLAPAGFTTSVGQTGQGSVVITYTATQQLFVGGTVTHNGTTWTHTFAPGTTTYFVSNFPGPYKQIRRGWAKLNGTWKDFYPSTGAVSFASYGQIIAKLPHLDPSMEVSPDIAGLLSQGITVTPTTTGVAPADTDATREWFNYQSGLIAASVKQYYLSQVTPYPVTASYFVAHMLPKPDGKVVVQDYTGSAVNFSNVSNIVGTAYTYIFDPTHNAQNLKYEDDFINAVNSAIMLSNINKEIAWDSPSQSFTFKVPRGIHSVSVDVVGAGGGGGGSDEVGVGSAGGGGGSGGYQINQILNVVPGEYLTITPGKPGFGAPFVGRTTRAPAGGAGGDSIIAGEFGSITATGGKGGAGGASDEIPQPSGGGGGGCKIICTKLHEFGYLSDHIYEADERFGEYLRANDPYAYYGYVKWASVVVDWMEKDGPQCMFWIRDKEKRNQAQRTMAINWARRIATPWAEHMAYIMGVGEKDNRAGKLIMKTGMWVSRMIGKYTKTTEPTKSVALGYVMWATFGVFWLLAGVK
jgi:hypothetical protein